MPVFRFNQVSHHADHSISTFVEPEGSGQAAGGRGVPGLLGIPSQWGDESGEGVKGPTSVQSFCSSEGEPRRRLARPGMGGSSLGGMVGLPFQPPAGLPGSLHKWRVR